MYTGKGREWRVIGSHKVVSQGSLKTENGYMTSTGIIFSYSYESHKATKCMANPPVSCVALYSQLSACPGKMKPFNLSTYGCLTGLRN